MRTGRIVWTASVTLALLVAGVGCTGKDGAPSRRGLRGGTLRVAAVAEDFDSLDTANAYGTSSWGLMRTYARTLYGYDTSGEPDQASVPVPDLADGPPRVSADHRTYTFTLRAGVRYAPPVNREVTAQDFVTAVERLYDKATPSGGQTYANLIAGANGTNGSGKARRIPGLVAVDSHTLRIRLVEPAGDFLSILALPFFAPVPGEYAARYTVGANYSGHVVGSGPYTLDRYVAHRSIVLVRNPNWDRPPIPFARPGWTASKSARRTSPAPSTRSNAATQTSCWGSSPHTDIMGAPRYASQRRMVLTGCVHYLTLETNRLAGPIADVRVRRAINYAVDKIAARDALGGGGLPGDVASTILPPTVPGHRSYNLYPTAGDHGDPGKARQLLSQAGHPDGLTLNYVASSSGGAGPVTAAIQAALAHAGIRLKVKTLEGFDLYAKSLSLPSKRTEHQIGVAAWCPDWPGDSARSFIVSLLDGRSIRPSSNSNYGEYNNPAVNAKIDQALAEPDRTKRGRLWAEIDRQIMQDAPWVPLTYDRARFIWGPRVRHWTYDPWTTTPDITALWLDPPRP